jgi:hypothetical protein
VEDPADGAHERGLRVKRIGALGVVKGAQAVLYMHAGRLAVADVAAVTGLRVRFAANKGVGDQSARREPHFGDVAIGVGDALGLHHAQVVACMCR